jgi:NTE family protein
MSLGPTPVVPQICVDASPPSRRHVLTSAAALALAGCTISADHDHHGSDAPGSTKLARTPRVAWVLSSGGPRGFVHVGVLKALHELGLKPDLIVGASAGAVVGSLFAARMPMALLERKAVELPAWKLARVNLVGDERLSGAALADMVREMVQEHAGTSALERLPTTMVCAAQRLADGVVVGFNRGDVGLAVQASAAIEGQFAPVRIRGQRYADADLRMPLPVRLARALGATRVLAVDASAHEDKAPPGTERWSEGDLRKRALTAPDARLADVLLHPDIGYYASITREYRERVIEAGYRATMAQAARLRAMHAA